MTTSKTSLSGLASIYSRVIEYFLPDTMARDREATNQARMFLMSHLFGPILGDSVPLALYIFDPTPGIDIAILFVSIQLFWVFPFLLRSGIAYSYLVTLSILNLNFAILWSCYHYGGVASPTLVWILIIPILSTFYIGGEQRLKPYLFAASGISFLVFLAAYLIFQPGPNDMPSAALRGLGAVSTVATLCYVAAMAIYYAKIFDAGVDLENEVKRRHAMAVDLRKAVLAAERAGAAKSEFLARMSHELRTPLNAIIGYGQILKEEAEETDDDLLLGDIDRILDAGRYLVRLINMILDLSKIEAGRIKFDIQPHDLTSVILEAVTRRQEAIEATGNSIDLQIPSSLDIVNVDHNRLCEILDAILENAAQHTQDGVITVSAYRNDAANPQTYSIAVGDTGSGIAPEVLPTIFETFSTSRDAAGGRYGGTGLNLTVSMRLCKAMGGDMTARSTLGQGSTFVIILPCDPDLDAVGGAERASETDPASAIPAAA